MAFLRDSTTIALYNEILNNPEFEEPARTFWAHVLKQDVFPENCFVVTSEAPPSTINQRRRVDIVVKMLNPKEHPVFIILLLGEVKKQNAYADLVDKVETQVYSAMHEYLVAYPNQVVQGLAMVGTKARSFSYDGSSDYLTALFGTDDLSDLSQYIDAGGSEEEVKPLRTQFDNVKRWALRGDRAPYKED